MKFRIHGTYPDGTTDSWLVEGDTIEEIRNAAMLIINARSLTDYYSEQVE